MGSVYNSIEEDRHIGLDEYRKELESMCAYLPSFDPKRPISGRDLYSGIFRAIDSLDSGNMYKCIDLSKKSIAKAIGISESAFRKLRNGNRRVTTSTFSQIVDKLAALAETCRDSTSMILQLPAEGAGSWEDRRKAASALIGIPDVDTLAHAEITSPKLIKLLNLCRSMDDECLDTVISVAELAMRHSR